MLSLALQQDSHQKKGGGKEKDYKRNIQPKEHVSILKAKKYILNMNLLKRKNSKFDNTKIKNVSFRFYWLGWVSMGNLLSSEMKGRED